MKSLKKFGIMILILLLQLYYYVGEISLSFESRVGQILFTLGVGIYIYVYATSRGISSSLNLKKLDIKALDILVITMIFISASVGIYTIINDNNIYSAQIIALFTMGLNYSNSIWVGESYILFRCKVIRKKDIEDVYLSAPKISVIKYKSAEIKYGFNKKVKMNIPVNQEEIFNFNTKK